MSIDQWECGYESRNSCLVLALSMLLARSMVSILQARTRAHLSCLLRPWQHESLSTPQSEFLVSAKIVPGIAFPTPPLPAFRWRLSDLLTRIYRPSPKTVCLVMWQWKDHMQSLLSSISTLSLLPVSRFFLGFSHSSLMQSRPYRTASIVPLRWNFVGLAFGVGVGRRDLKSKWSIFSVKQVWKYHGSWILVPSNQTMYSSGRPTMTSTGLPKYLLPNRRHPHHYYPISPSSFSALSQVELVGSIPGILDAVLMYRSIEPSPFVWDYTRCITISSRRYRWLKRRLRWRWGGGMLFHPSCS